MFEELTRNISIKGWALMGLALVVGLSVEGFLPQPDHTFEPGDESYANMPTYDDWPGSWQHESMPPVPAISPSTDLEPRVGSLPDQSSTLRY